jgi:hypothetical protein
MSIYLCRVQNYLFAKAKRLQEVHVWLSLAMSFITYGILFNYLNEYLHDVQKDNFELGKGKYSSLMLVLLGFYFLEFCLFTITAVANRAIIVAAFNSQVRAITEEQSKDDILLDSREELEDVFKA